VSTGHATVGARFSDASSIPARTILRLGVAVTLGALALVITIAFSTFFGLAAISLVVGTVTALVPPAVNTLSGASVAPKEHSYAIVSLSSVRFLSQRPIAPVFGISLATFGYAATYPVAGLIAIALVTLLPRGGKQMANLLQTATA
jgi:hypothetical protein